jgi:hypothetical protein
MVILVIFAVVFSIAMSVVKWNLNRMITEKLEKLNSSIELLNSMRGKNNE